MYIIVVSSIAIDREIPTRTYIKYERIYLNRADSLDVYIDKMDKRTDERSLREVFLHSNN